MTDERRRYFRIDDSLGIAYNKIDTIEAGVVKDQIAQGGQGVDLVSNFDNRIHTLIDTLKIRDEVAAELIDLINKKLNFVVGQLDIDTELMQKVAYTLRQVNVSGCGIAFADHELLEPGQLLQLDVVLYPSELCISTVSRVVACDRLAVGDLEGDYLGFTRADFECINSHDQELLIQHVVKRQSQLLKQGRRERES